MARTLLTAELKAECRDRIVAVFAARDIEAPAFMKIAANRTSLSGQFRHQGRLHEIMIDDDNVVMLAGKQLLECYMPAEFESAESLIASFSERLGRYLDGGAWAGPNEKGIRELLVSALRRAIGK